MCSGSCGQVINLVIVANKNGLQPEVSIDIFNECQLDSCMPVNVMQDPPQSPVADAAVLYQLVTIKPGWLCLGVTVTVVVCVATVDDIDTCWNASNWTSTWTCAIKTLKYHLLIEHFHVIPTVLDSTCKSLLKVCTCLCH